MCSSDQAIIVENVSKKYRTGNYTVNVLENVNLSIGRGEICVLMGRSGSGKTTLLNIIGGLMKPDSGSVIIDGETLYSDKHRPFSYLAISDKKCAEIRNNKIGYVYQDLNLVKELNVLENIRLPFDIARKKYDIEYEQKIRKLLSLQERLRFYPRELSGGERQRAAIARALIKKASIILADEPNGSIDSHSSRELMNYVRETNRDYGQTYLIATHDRVWLDHADSAYEIFDGSLRKGLTDE